MRVEIHPAIALAAKAMGELYAVGGSVRNALLGLPSSDLDVCSRLTPLEVAARLEGTDINVLPKAPHMGTVELRVPWEGCVYTLEHTTFRRDSYVKGHRPESVAFTHSLEEDAFRRDFSVNALYVRAATGEVTDPTGGLLDLQGRVLRAVTPDPDAVLRQDGLRLLRLVRFSAQLGFSIEKNTLESAKRNAGLLGDIAPERKLEELKKLLLSDVKYGPPQYGESAPHYLALARMADLGLMEHVLPELTEGREVEQKKQYHAYTVMSHGFHACAQAPPDLTLRLAALLHDVGKPRSVGENGRMLGHDALGARLAEEMLYRLRADNKLTKRVALLISIHMFDLKGEAKTNTIRKRFAQWGREVSEQFILLRRADFIGSGRMEGPEPTAARFEAVLGDMLRQGAPFCVNDICITGEEIARLTGAQGREIGAIKQALFMHCAVKPGDNNKRRLEQLAKNAGRR